MLISTTAISISAGPAGLALNNIYMSLDMGSDSLSFPFSQELDCPFFEFELLDLAARSLRECIRWPQEENVFGHCQKMLMMDLNLEHHLK
jgi:hypothetical protein